MSSQVKEIASIRTLTNFAFNRFLFYFFYIPMGVGILNSALQLVGIQLFDALTIQETVLILGGMILSLLNLIWVIISFQNIELWLGHVGDFLVGLLLMGSEYSGLVVKVWMWIFFLPFTLVEFFFGFDLLDIQLSWPFKVFSVSFEVEVRLNIRSLVEEMIGIVVEALTPNVSPFEYFSLKAQGEIVGFQLDGSALSGAFGSSALLRALTVRVTNEKEEEEE